eukprot:2985175-Prorocentrum_lima.AAC.1
MSIRRILRTDAKRAQAHSILHRIAQDQGLIPQDQHLQARPRARGCTTHGKEIQDKIQEHSPRTHKDM